MATTSVPSVVFAAVAVCIISILVLLLLRHYIPLRSTPAYLLVPVFLALALPCSIILLVPIDLASTTGDGHVPETGRGIWLPERVVLVTWRITYWLTFVLTWSILPLLGEYCDSGFRDPQDRMMYSLRSNAKYQLIYLGSGIAGLVYFVLQNGFQGRSLKGMVMALAYAWGLFLAIGLMGHGLVALPRRLYMNAFVGKRLRRIQGQAPKVKDKLDDATDELEGLENTVAQLKQRKTGITSRDLQDWIDELADTSSRPDTRPGARAAIAATNANIPAVVTERYVADLTRKLKRARHKKARFVDEWARLCQRAQDAQTILDAASSWKLEFKSVKRTPMSSIKLLTPTARYYVHAYAIPWTRVGLAVLLASASVVLIWSEFTKGFLSGRISVIGLMVVHSGSVNFGSQLLAGLWLLYMCTCALYAVSDVKVWGNRALVTRQTYAESATWYSLQVAKLTVPLSYNFITMLPSSVYQDTQFYQFLGKLIDLTPLGSGFSQFFPCLILIPAAATLFNLYGKVTSWFGVGGVLEDESEDNPSGFGTGGWREGRALIERELQHQNAGATSLGLSPRGPSLDVERGRPPTSSAATAAGTSTPPRGHGTAESRQPLLPAFAADTRIRDANSTFNSITNQQEDAEEDNSARHFYQDFTERVRNTFETTDRPEWVKDIGGVFKKPKWMQDNEAGQGRSSSGGDSNFFTRLFNSGDSDGQVRL